MAKNSSPTKRTDYQPSDGSISLLSMRAAFFERIAEIAPEIVDDFFQRSFNALQKWPMEKGSRAVDFDTSTEIATGVRWRRYPHFPLEPKKPDWWPLNYAVKDWAVEYRIEADWCRDFASLALRRYWTWHKFPAPQLMVFVIRFLQGEHLDAWRVEVKEMRRSAEAHRSFWDLFDPEQFAKSKHLEPIRTRAKQPIPPKQFPSRIVGTRILTREEYKQAAKDALAFEVFKWQAGGLSMKDSQEIGAAIFEKRKWEADDYNEAFDRFLQECGWVEMPRKRELQQHLDWVIYSRCKKLKNSEIHESFATTTSARTISNEIRDTEKALGFESVKQRGGSRPGTRKRQKGDPADRGKTKIGDQSTFGAVGKKSE